MNENDWHDIGDIDDFMEHYEFNDYVVVIGHESGDPTDDYTDIAFGIKNIPEDAKRFFCIPCDFEVIS